MPTLCPLHLQWCYFFHLGELKLFIWAYESVRFQRVKVHRSLFTGSCHGVLWFQGSSNVGFFIVLVHTLNSKFHLLWVCWTSFVKWAPCRRKQCYKQCYKTASESIIELQKSYQAVIQVKSIKVTTVVAHIVQIYKIGFRIFIVNMFVHNEISSGSLDKKTIKKGQPVQ